MALVGLGWVLQTMPVRTDCSHSVKVEPDNLPYERHKAARWRTVRFSRSCESCTALYARYCCNVYLALPGC